MSRYTTYGRTTSNTSTSQQLSSNVNTDIGGNLVLGQAGKVLLDPDDLIPGQNDQVASKLYVDQEISGVISGIPPDQVGIQTLNPIGSNSVTAEGGAIDIQVTGTGLAVTGDDTLKRIDFDVTGINTSINTLNSHASNTSNPHSVTYTQLGNTDAITEGTTNLFFTTAEKSKLAGVEANSNNYTTFNSDFDTRLGTKNTDDINEGLTNLFYTSGRFTTDLAGKTTDDLTEGTNLYYTDTRADARVNIHGSRTDNPHSVTKEQLGLGDVSNIKHNFVGTTQPASFNDDTQGYSVGSIWIDTVLTTSFICIDATTGSAVWTRISLLSDAEIKTAYENNPDTNTLTDLLLSKLNAIEDNATADQTGAEIKTLYELEADTNAYTDVEKSKLAGIQDNANNYTTFNSDFDTRLGTKTTTDIAEGTNLYFNTSRVDTHLNNNVIDDVGAVSGTKLWSSNKVNTEINNAISGLDIKDCVQTATTMGQNIDLVTGGLIVVDGVTTTEGMRVLVKNQTDPKENGIYTASSGSWTRSTDMDGTPANEVSAGNFTFVCSETPAVNAKTGWVVLGDGILTLGTHDINWAPFSSATDYTADESTLTLAGTVFSVKDNAQLVLSGIDTTAPNFIIDNPSGNMQFNANSDITLNPTGETISNQNIRVVAGKQLQSNTLNPATGVGVNVNGFVFGTDDITCNFTKTTPATQPAHVKLDSNNGITLGTANLNIISENAIDLNIGNSNVVSADALSVDVVPELKVNQINDRTGGGVTIETANINAGLIKGANGSVTAPTFTFNSEPSLGFYRCALSCMSFAVGGADRLRIEGATIRPHTGATMDLGYHLTGTAWNHVYAKTQNAGTPAYSFENDTNTGIYSPAAENVSISCAGAQKFNVSSASTTCLTPLLVDTINDRSGGGITVEGMKINNNHVTDVETFKFTDSFAGTVGTTINKFSLLGSNTTYGISVYNQQFAFLCNFPTCSHVFYNDGSESMRVGKTDVTVHSSRNLRTDTLRESTTAGLTVQDTKYIHFKDDVGTPGSINKICMWGAGCQYGFGISNHSIDYVTYELANHNFYAGATNILTMNATANTSHVPINVNVINEKTLNAGVNIDSVLVKDNTVSATLYNVSTNGLKVQENIIGYDESTQPTPQDLVIRAQRADDSVKPGQSNGGNLSLNAGDTIYNNDNPANDSLGGGNVDIVCGTNQSGLLKGGYDGVMRVYCSNSAGGHNEKLRISKSSVDLKDTPLTGVRTLLIYNSVPTGNPDPAPTFTPAVTVTWQAFNVKRAYIMGESHCYNFFIVFTTPQNADTETLQFNVSQLNIPSLNSTGGTIIHYLQTTPGGALVELATGLVQLTNNNGTVTIRSTSSNKFNKGHQHVLIGSVVFTPFV